MYLNLLILVLVSIAHAIPLVAIYRAEMRAFMRPRLVAAPDVLYADVYNNDWIGLI